MQQDTSAERQDAGTERRNASTGRASEEVLQPFSGRVLFGICFESGHSIWLYDFESTPTGLGGYREVWVVDPDDSRTLYYDVEGADAEIARFHDWDRAVRADMTWEWADDRIAIHVEGDDGSTVDFTGVVDDSIASRVLTLVQRYLPGSLHERVFLARTETGKRGHIDARTVAVITEAAASIDGSSLGAVRQPERPITFGEVRALRQPFVFVGDLLLDYPRR